jgi:hypothetical protein
MLMHRAAGFHFDDCWQDVLMGLTTVAVMQDHPQAAFIREGEAIVTDATPPGRDPLLTPASAAVVDVEAEDPEPTPGPFPSAEERMTATEVLERQGKMPDEPIITDPIEGPEDGEPDAATDPMDEEPAAVICIGGTCNRPVELDGLDDFCTDCRRVIDEQSKELAEKEEKEEKAEKAEKPKKKAARKKKPVVDQQAPFIATCSVDGCGKEFDPHKEVHWNHEGVFRCGKCGQFPK